MGANEIIWVGLFSGRCEDYRPERFKNFFRCLISLGRYHRIYVITKISTHSEIYEIDTSGVYQSVTHINECFQCDINILNEQSLCFPSFVGAGPTDLVNSNFSFVIFPALELITSPAPYFRRICFPIYIQSSEAHTQLASLGLSKSSCIVRPNGACLKFLEQDGGWLVKANKPVKKCYVQTESFQIFQIAHKKIPDSGRQFCSHKWNTGLSKKCLQLLFFRFVTNDPLACNN